MLWFNHDLKRVLIYKLRAQCGSGCCIVCKGPLARDFDGKPISRHLCIDHRDYKIGVWSESQNFAVCDHCHYSAVRRGLCFLCQRYSPTKALGPSTLG